MCLLPIFHTDFLADFRTDSARIAVLRISLRISVRIPYGLPFYVFPSEVGKWQISGKCPFTPAVWMNIFLLRQKQQNIQNPKKHFSNIFLRGKILNLK